MTIVQNKHVTFLVTTNDVDVDAGYPEYSDSFKHITELLPVIERAEVSGVPLHRLSIIEVYSNPDTDEYVAELVGTLDDYTP